MTARFLLIAVAYFIPAGFAGAGEAEKRKTLEAEIAALEASMKAATPEIEDEMHEWESDLHLPVKWEPLTVVVAESRHGRLEPQPDGSLKAPPSLAGNEIYTIRATTTLKEITAFRVEALLDSGTVGRSGNAVLTEFQATVAPENAAPRPGNVRSLKFSSGSADFAQKGFGPQAAIDGDPKTGWAFLGATDKPHAAVFELSTPLGVGAGELLTIVLWQDYTMQSLNRVRISVTTKAPPVRELPESIRETIALEPSERTAEQRAELLDYFRPMAKAYATVNKQIREKREELAKLKPAERSGGRRGK